MKGLTITGICAVLMLSFAVPVVAEAQALGVRNSGGAQETKRQVVYPKISGCVSDYLCPSRTRFLVKFDPWLPPPILGSSAYVDWAIDSSSTAVRGTNWVFWPNQSATTARCTVSDQQFCFLPIGIKFDRNCEGIKKIRLKVSGYGLDGIHGEAPWNGYPDGVEGVFGIDINCDI